MPKELSEETRHAEAKDLAHSDTIGQGVGKDDE